MAKQPKPKHALPQQTGKVFMGCVHGSMVHALWHTSILKVLWWDVRHRQRIIPNGGWLDVQSSPRIASNRNICIREFLNVQNQPEWLWMTDTDMVFPGDIVDQMMAVAHPKDVPVLGALCFAGEPGRMWPSMYRLGVEGEPLMVRMDDYPRDALCRVEGTGAACLLMHRSALVTVLDKWGHSAYPWFAETEHGGFELGEDVSLMLKFHGCGIPVHVDTRIKIGHVKHIILDEALFDSSQDAPPAEQLTVKAV